MDDPTQLVSRLLKVAGATAAALVRASLDNDMRHQVAS
jgi:hypothetical protein